MRHGTSPTSIISPTATRRSRGSWSARSFPASRRATPWTTSCWRRSTTARSTAAISRSASVSIRPACMSRQSGDKAQVAYVRDGALHRVEARHAVLACFHMMIPHIMPELPAPQRAALAQERQDADLLHQRAGAQLAGLRRTSRSVRSRRRWASTIRCRSIFRSASAATAIRAIRPSRCCCISSMCPARRTRGSMRARSSASGRASSMR